ncbi:hypothetical protein B0H13DRAFT_2290946, partial [Mycena leptocephala]
MAARVEAIDLALERIHTKRISLMINDDPNVAIAQLRTEEQALDSRLRKIQDRLYLLEKVKDAMDAKEIDRELKELDIHQAALEKERADCGHIITAEAFHSSPIRRMPDDILTEIFITAKGPQLDAVGTGIVTIVTQ